MIASLSLIFEILISFEKDKTDISEVSYKALEYGLKWFEVLLSHANKLYATDLQEGVYEAHLLVKKIEKAHLFDGEPLREICRHRWGGLNNMDAIESGLKLLEDHGWVQAITYKPISGGRPSKIVKINPKVLDTLR